MFPSLALVSLAVAATSTAAPFAPLPPVEKGAPPTGLELRIVSYDGATNGELRVEVRNPGAQAATFSPVGLYFIPNVRTDLAPQRLGAVGTLQLRSNEGWKRRDDVSVAPGASAQLKLDVYCIDSHRPSPTSGTPFRLAKDRMPKQLARDIDTATKMKAAPLGGIGAPNAKSAVQTEVWENRNKAWYKLDGEGAQEAGK